MDALDEATLRKRRDRLLNPITAPFIFLREAMFTYAPPPPIPPPFVFGAMAHGVIDDVASSYCDGGSISLSKYPLSGAYALSRLLNAFEHHLGVL